MGVDDLRYYIVFTNLRGVTVKLATVDVHGDYMMKNAPIGAQVQIHKLPSCPHAIT